jgi:hypothetical protein
MWLFTSDSFVSIVEHRDDPTKLIVRGRFAGDVARFLGMPASREEVTPAADYRYRVIVQRSVVEEALERACETIDYPNFKDSIKTSWRKAVAMRVWSILHGAQGDRLPMTAGPAYRATAPRVTRGVDSVGAYEAVTTPKGKA